MCNSWKKHLWFLNLVVYSILESLKSLFLYLPYYLCMCKRLVPNLVKTQIPENKCAKWLPLKFFAIMVLCMCHSLSKLSNFYNICTCIMVIIHLYCIFCVVWDNNIICYNIVSPYMLISYFIFVLLNSNIILNETMVLYHMLRHWIKIWYCVIWWYCIIKGYNILYNIASYDMILYYITWSSYYYHLIQYYMIQYHIIKYH